MPVAREKFGAWGVDDGEAVQGTAGGGGATEANGVGVQGGGRQPIGRLTPASCCFATRIRLTAP